MTLSGLLDAVLPDPALSQAVTSAGVASLDLAAPPALRPLVAAALAADPARGGAGRPVLAVTATGRDADDLVDALRCLLPPDEVVALPVLGDAAARAALAPRGHRRPPAGGAAPAGPPEHRRPGDRPGTGRGRLDPSVLQPQVPGLGELEPVAARAGDTAELDELVERLAVGAATPGSSWSRSAASSPSAAASSTSSRPPRSTRCGSSSGATTSRRCASSPSPTSARPAPAEHGLWAPPCRELLLTAPVRERAKQLAAEHPELAEMLDQLADGIAVEGMESLAPVLVDDLRLVLHELPAGHARAGLRPGAGAHPGGGAGAHRRRSSSQASWAAAAGGGTAPIDLGAAALRSPWRTPAPTPPSWACRGGRSPRSPPTWSWPTSPPDRR